MGQRETVRWREEISPLPPWSLRIAKAFRKWRKFPKMPGKFHAKRFGVKNTFLRKTTKKK
jgi:hypothetical protein